MTPKTRNIIRAIFNVANLAALGAVALSQGAGSAFGTVMFIIIALIGTWNKYAALTRGAPGRMLRDPALTATALMVASGCNCLLAVAAVFSGPPQERVHNASRALCWFFGLLGDNSIRRMDRINFKSVVRSAPGSAARLAVQAALANPVVFYNAGGIALTGAVLRNAPRPPGETLWAVAIVCVYAAGIVHAAARTVLALRGKIPRERINDGFVNCANAAGLIAQGILAAVGGNKWVMAAQFIFAVSSIKALYETRESLK